MEIYAIIYLDNFLSKMIYFCIFMADSKQDAVAEIEDIFNKAKTALLSLHHQKMALIKKFKDVDDAAQAADILNKLKQLS